ncbi:hypothetical protein ACFZ8E_23040 [Methylobacterium sp. HMF5984]|uniref:hypothetical protein n=1 Tax=Methylobacterium sp. HMF5984 TaxID=3367370 RepID=UPI0038521541
MPMNLHQGCMKRLVEILATALPDLPVHSRMFVLMETPSPLAALDEAIPDKGGRGLA